jgi:uncharacterized protein (DUF302 family)
MTVDGLITVASRTGVKDTMDRLEADIITSGMAVFARIDHAGGASAVEMSLRPTELLIFGNAKAGTPLMQAEQSIGIDLPLKALVYQDAAGQTWVAYNDPRWLAQRHALGATTASAVAAMAATLASVMGRVTGSL